MRIDVLTLFPGLLTGFLKEGIIHKGIENHLVEIVFHNIRDKATDKYKSVDDYAFGGGAGMVMMAEPIVKSIEELQKSVEFDEIIYLTPDGETLNQSISNELSLKNNLLLICGRYKGIDQRVRDKWVTREISIGDYVLTGGELAAAVLIDSVVRLLPGVLNDESSALFDSFQDGLLDAPVYTRPADFRGMKVPEILLSGNHREIEKWNYEQSLEKTRTRRPDLLED